MARSGLAIVTLCLCNLCSAGSALARGGDALSAIPRVDVHSHIGSVERMEHYVKVGEALKEQYGINLAAWIDLNFARREGSEDTYLDAAANKYKGRFLPCINDYKISDGLRYPPEELSKWLQKGIVGYKIWVGVSPMIDTPANDATFSKMEEIGMIGASIHISQPYPTKWCEDPVKFWEAQNAWERVLDRHPNLKVVNAHMLDHFNSDEQLDYLMYVLETYPNVYVDLAARFQQFHRMDRDKLRNFMIKYADRILFGTDIGGQPAEGRYRQVAESYYRAFQLLETDNVVKGGFFGTTETRGLALPTDVLEKIYYRNAARLYPRVRDVLKDQVYQSGPSLIGSTLEDWNCYLADPKAQVQDVWSVEDGVLICKGKPLGYLYTKKDYGNFVLKLQWRWPAGKEPGNGGVLIRMTGGDRIWPKSLEAQLNTGNAGDFWGLAGYPLAGPAERMRSADNKEFGRLTNLKKTRDLEKPAGQWNTYEIISADDAVTLVINGEEVNRATGCVPTTGRICLTSEGNEIHFRNVVVTGVPQ